MKPTYDELVAFLRAYLLGDEPKCSCALCVRARQLVERLDRKEVAN